MGLLVGNQRVAAHVERDFLRCAVAGSTCKDISTFGALFSSILAQMNCTELELTNSWNMVFNQGAKQGHWGDSGEVLAVWFAERYWCQEAIVLK